MSVIGSGKRDVRLFSRAIEQIGNGEGANSVLLNLVRLAAEAAKSTAASLYLLDEQQGVLKPAVIYGLPQDYVKTCGDAAVGTQCCGRAVQHYKPCIVPDLLADPAFSDRRDALKTTGIRAAFSVPVLNGDHKCLGSLACHFGTPHMPTNYEIERNEIFATLIAFAIATHGLPVLMGEPGWTLRRSLSPLAATASNYTEVTKSPAL